MDNYEKCGEVTFLWKEWEEKGVKALNEAGFELCIVNVDRASTTWVLMKKKVMKD